MEMVCVNKECDSIDTVIYFINMLPFIIVGFFLEFTVSLTSHIHLYK